MPKYKLEYPTKSYFESPGPEGVIDELYKTFVGSDPIREDFVKELVQRLRAIGLVSQ
tara:strand:+ start:957 stop:1127 length:171 start_codon:yes stop_codon:yes gene_type:complete